LSAATLCNISVTEATEPLSRHFFRELPSMLLDGKRILLVEDNPDQQRLYLNFLLKAGASVTLECNGHSAVQTARKADYDGEPFDAAVMDLYLFQSDGMQATRSILQDDPSIAIVAITAKGSPEIEHAWRLAGASDYLNKPIERQRLIDSLARCIAEKQADTERGQRSSRASGALQRS
jgi:CheY-like chemotaxis protein